MTEKKRIVTGILAHVDAGKTTLTEALLYHSGTIRTLGRVDHRNAFFDTDVQERERGITIYSKQAELIWNGHAVTLLDTPGHADFSAEAERTLSVLDCAVLLINGADGIQSHTRTLWRLLEKHRVPVFFFINKTDQVGVDSAAVMRSLRQEFGDGCIDFSASDRDEQIALCDEALLTRFLEDGCLRAEDIAAQVALRHVFPCYAGSALRLLGVEELLDSLCTYLPQPQYPQIFGAQIYKITRDPQGTRLTWLKIIGGTLRVRDTLRGVNHKTGEAWEEKVAQIRIYSSEKYQAVDSVQSGMVCAVTGLQQSRAGEGLGIAANAAASLLEPALRYRITPGADCDIHTLLQKLRLLEEENPCLYLSWNEHLREIHVRLMGDMQVETLKRQIWERFHITADFDEGGIIYRETIAATVEGIGHYEPLRHYAEVHLLLQPLPRGSGIQIASDCREDMLERNWQRLILTHLAEKEHLGVLTGSPITDMQLTLIAGRAHIKHTEGGDFRQATYRAVRQGLMQAESILLEPWNEVTIRVPNEYVGRAMTDIQQMGGTLRVAEVIDDKSILTGTAPLSAVRHYARTLAAYTGSRGELSLAPGGYSPCTDQEKCIAAFSYDAARDTENPADSVFCDHGAGVIVPWNEVEACAHIAGVLRQDTAETEEAPSRRKSVKRGSAEEDRELLAIFEKTYGPVKQPRLFQETKRDIPRDAIVTISPPRREFLLVDGYNVIHAWDTLKRAAAENMDAARQLLMDMLCNYQGLRQCIVILVFDAYRAAGGSGTMEQYHNIYVVYTKEAETADSYIERTTYRMQERRRVRVVTSDSMERLIILGHGAERVTAEAFRAEVEAVAGEIAAQLARGLAPGRSGAIRQAWQEAEEKKNG